MRQFLSLGVVVLIVVGLQTACVQVNNEELQLRTDFETKLVASLAENNVSAAESECMVKELSEKFNLEQMRELIEDDLLYDDEGDENSALKIFFRAAEVCLD